jgi:hypothetical protein
VTFILCDGSCRKIGGRSFREMEYGTRDTEHGIRDAGYGREHGIRDAEHGIRNTGHGTRDTEHGIRDTEYGTRNTEHGITRFSLVLDLWRLRPVAASIFRVSAFPAALSLSACEDGRPPVFRVPYSVSPSPQKRANQSLPTLSAITALCWCDLRKTNSCMRRKPLKVAQGIAQSLAIKMFAVKVDRQTCTTPSVINQLLPTTTEYCRTWRR